MSTFRPWPADHLDARRIWVILQPSLIAEFKFSCAKPPKISQWEETFEIHLDFFLAFPFCTGFPFTSGIVRTSFEEDNAWNQLGQLPLSNSIFIVPISAEIVNACQPLCIRRCAKFALQTESRRRKSASPPCGWSYFTSVVNLWMVKPSALMQRYLENPLAIRFNGHRREA